MTVGKGGFREIEVGKHIIKCDKGTAVTVIDALRKQLAREVSWNFGSSGSPRGADGSESDVIVEDNEFSCDCLEEFRHERRLVGGGHVLEFRELKVQFVVVIGAKTRTRLVRPGVLSC